MGSVGQNSSPRGGSVPNQSAVSGKGQSVVSPQVNGYIFPQYNETRQTGKSINININQLLRLEIISWYVNHIGPLRHRPNQCTRERTRCSTGVSHFRQTGGARGPGFLHVRARQGARALERDDRQPARDRQHVAHTDVMERLHGVSMATYKLTIKRHVARAEHVCVKLAKR